MSFGRAWRDISLWTQTVAAFVIAARKAEGRDAVPTVVVESRLIKTTESGGPRTFDADKKVKGRKRHLAVDTIGFPTERQIPVVSKQVRDGLAPLPGAVRRRALA